MKSDGPSKLLSVYTDEAEKWHHQSLYMAIVERAHKEGLRGATVFRGIAGYGAHRSIHTTNILVLSADLPVVVQIVDEAERIERFLAILDDMVPEGLITVQDLAVAAYRHR